MTVVTGYRASEVEDHLRGACGGPDYRFVANDRYATTNNVVSLGLALSALESEEDVLLIECDLHLTPGLLHRLSGRDRGNVALVSRYRAGMDGTVVTLGGGLVTRVIPPSAQGPAFSYHDTYKTLNVYRFSRAFCHETLAPLVHEHVGAVDTTSFYEVVLARLGDLTPHRIAAEVVDGAAWAEVDDPHDLAAARFQFEPERRSAILDRSRGGHWSFDMVDFALLRNAYFPTDAMLAALRHGLATLVDGYGSTQTVLDEKLAWFLECPPERVEALNGASQAFPILRRLWADRTVARPEPTFGEFAAAFPGAVTYADAPGIDVEDLERLAGEVEVMVVVNPGNPTGTTLPPAGLHALAARHPETRFLVDESFLGFSGHRPLQAELEERPLANVVVLTSLSKTLCAPGLRIGYLYSADREFLDAVRAELPIWNMGAPAEYVLELLLKFRPQLAESLERTRRDREAFRAALASSAAVAEVYPSGANFLLVRLRGPAGVAAELREALLVSGAIDVKDVTDRFADRQPRLRLAVRRPEENAGLMAAIEHLVAASPGGSG